jgi:UDP:flavonoid glycosyltransferase YjiC (YdhE family)
VKFLLLSIGTRGDAEPFLTIGDLLQKAGHEVVIALPAQFRHLADDAGLAFAPLDERFLELLEGQTAKDFMGQKGSWLQRIVQLRKLSKDSISVQKDLIREQSDLLKKHRPDRVVYHPKCLLARAWGMANPGRAIGISPIPNWLHPVREYPHIAINAQLGKTGNLLTYRLINFATALMSARYFKPFAEDFPGTRLTRSAVARHMATEERMLYLISPTLFPRPTYWPTQAKVMGYFERPKTNHWAPDPDLLDFLARHAGKDVTFITFGSMVNARPEATTRAILAVLRQHRIPAILNTSAGGLLRLEEEAPDHVHFVSNIPYEWIFPRVHSVVHHGGSGTTHTAIKHGCASLIVPHIVDQFFWNRRCAELGVGPLGVKIKRLDEISFTPLLLGLRNTPDYNERAGALSRSMVEEAQVEPLLAALTR